MLIVTLSEVLGILVILFMIVVYGSMLTAEWWRQKCCDHDEGVHETRSCDAICSKCGKNLGFIGSEKNKQRKRL